MVYEPHLDHSMFQHLVITSGHMNMSALFGKLILRYFNNPDATTWMHGGAPRHRINLLLASEWGHAIAYLARSDPGAQKDNLKSLNTLGRAFNNTFSPDAYLVNNEQLWYQLHDMLNDTRQQDP